MYPFKEKQKPSPMDMKTPRRTKEKQEYKYDIFEKLEFTIC
jgi:hypothetical protein